VIEFEAPEIASLEAEVAARHRFLPEHHKVEIYGLCEECHD
jgi:Fe2+ or Zn2+ uptake regulation protein